MARPVGEAAAERPSKAKKDPEPAANGTTPAGAASAEAAPLDDAQYRDFFWTYTEEPHRTRRLAIIKAHPEVS